MSYFIATAPIDPAANEIRGFLRTTQEDAETIAFANTRANQPWAVYELLECAQIVSQEPKLTRSREPAPKASDANAVAKDT